MIDPTSPPTVLPPEAAQWAQELELEPLPHEGGLFRQMHLDDHSSAIYYLLADPDFSALHSLGSVEVYHWYAGAPLQLLLLHPDGRIDEPILGPDLAAGQRPQIIVPAGVMQGSYAAGSWSLVGTTMSPPFQWNEFVLGDRAELHHTHGAAKAQISRLTRDA